MGPTTRKKGSGVTPQSVRESCQSSSPSRDQVRPCGSSPPVPEIPTPVPDSRPPKTWGDKRFIAEIRLRKGAALQQGRAQKKGHDLASSPVPLKEPATGDVVSRRRAPPFGSVASNASSGKEKKGRGRERRERKKKRGKGEEREGEKEREKGELKIKRTNEDEM